MRKLNKLLFLLLFPLIAEVVVSCCDCSDSFLDSAVVQIDQDVSRISLQIFDNNFRERGNIYSSGVNDTILRSTLGIYLRVDDVLAIMNNKVSTTGFFINSAQATSCDCPPANLVEIYRPVSDFKITTVSKFDSTHPAGSEVTSYFKLFENDKYIDLVPDFKIRGITPILLMVPPTDPGNYQFDFSLTLANGVQIVKRTDNVYLL